MSNFFRRRSRPYAPEGGLRLRDLPDAQSRVPNANMPNANMLNYFLTDY
ncbi:MAG: hypothetical protein F6J93_29525 [Oscillatoria sp. SIO1A7]|nr:hypothetical protein [Oscillatoria sp. SIO1A7]